MSEKVKNYERAFPSESYNHNTGDLVSLHEGLTKRELFAGMAMQGMLVTPDELAGKTMNERYDNIAEFAVKYADALIKELNLER